MKFNIKTTLTEIARLERELKKYIDTKKDFETSHKNVIELCKIIFDRKSYYKNIDITYPEKIFVNTIGTNERNEITDYEGEKSDLAKNELKILEEIRNKIRFRAKIVEHNKQNFMLEIGEINKKLDEILKIVRKNK